MTHPAAAQLYSLFYSETGLVTICLHTCLAHLRIGEACCWGDVFVSMNIHLIATKMTFAAARQCFGKGCQNHSGP